MPILHTVISAYNEKGRIKMKKRIAYILMSVLVMTASLGLAACGSGSDDEGDTTTAATTTNNEVTTLAPTETEEDTTAVDDNKVAYKVKVVDEAGNPIANAMVQMCKDSCVPAVTNAEGVAEFNLESDDYDVKFIELPAGYTYSGEEQVFKFAEGETELTLTLKAE